MLLTLQDLQQSSRTHYRQLRLILGDQLNADHSWYKIHDPACLYVITELHQETSYVTHHVQKICAFFSAMQHFADALSQSGHHVVYLTLDDTSDFKTLPVLLAHIVAVTQVDKLEYQRPDEYRLKQQLAGFSLAGCDLVQADTEHFLLAFDEIEHQFTAGKSAKMEFFYRRMRKRFDILMADGEPVGGQWNFDQNNRHALKAGDIAELPEPLLFGNDVTEILERLQRHQLVTIGRAEKSLLWPVSRQQALMLLDYFCEHLLGKFGHFQDAMTSASTYRWSLYHSRLSFALNAKILSPDHVINYVIEYWEQHPASADIAQVEGFVRQILGWREFVRGIYWANMPTYADANALDAQRPLPGWFWTGDTKMHCMQQAIDQSLDHAYAHHIQRLMITGNFCLLTGIDPDAVDAWYLGVYIDAIEWVEMPNTRGMSQFADGGIVATKPYAASGSYVNKMSDYCKQCAYDVKHKTEDDACPFNSLYWHFIDRHAETLLRNPRMRMVFSSWQKMADEQRLAILDKAENTLTNLEHI
ncbi:(6-4) photolyase [BD1-7 clade bacterium]|nr:(6-4) photolyase [BD1-7 clade bacterium]